MPITFAPTYRVVKDADPEEIIYTTKRYPAWTDRVFYRAADVSTGFKVVASEYNSRRVQGSDHYPVILKAEVVYDRKIKTAFRQIANSSKKRKLLKRSTNTYTSLSRKRGRDDTRKLEPDSE
jgi:hypothetical protein